MADRHVKRCPRISKVSILCYKYSLLYYNLKFTYYVHNIYQKNADSTGISKELFPGSQRESPICCPLSEEGISLVLQHYMFCMVSKAKSSKKEK